MIEVAAELVERLIDALEAERIQYCHWKSNEALAASAAGENDLDLLVSRADVARCRSILHEMGFVEAVQRSSRRVPGILDYYGNSPGSARPIHVHLHTRLVIGDDMTKNFHLPIEAAYLRSAERSGALPVPSPEFELCTFAIRMVLKHCTWDAQLTFQGTLAASESRELDYLSHRADIHSTRELIEQHLPEVGGELFEDCLSAVSGERGPLARALIARRLQRTLSLLSARPVWSDVLLKTLRRLYWLSRRTIRPRSRRKGLAHGGLVVAIRGGETDIRRRLIEQLDQWLSRDLAVLPIEYRHRPRRAARRAHRFSAAGGIVLTGDHPIGRNGIPPPDLEVWVEGSEPEGPSQPGVVYLTADPTGTDRYEGIKRAIWDRL